MIRIELLDKSYSEKLFNFEKENRDYFKSIGLPRKDAYYEYQSFIKIINELVEEQSQGFHYMYLVIDEQENIVGRINLTNVVQGPLKKAELGYRVGKGYQEKGYATKAIKLITEKAYKEHMLHRLEAGTSPQNIASQIVLIKNGFQFAGKYHQYILGGDSWTDCILFEKVLEDSE